MMTHTQEFSWLCDAAVPAVGGYIGGALTAPLYLYSPPTPLHLGLSAAIAGVTGYSAGKLCHAAVGLYEKLTPDPTPKPGELMVLRDEGAVRS